MDNNFAVTIARDHELAQFIEEGRQQALVQIARMREQSEPEDATNGERDARG